MADVFLARQPIFDVRQNVYGYEIFYRSSERNCFDNTRGDIATASTLMNTFVTFGLDNLTNQKPAFINFDESFIIEEIPSIFPKDLLVIELLQPADPGNILLEKCKALREKGYVIALDNFVFQTEYESLLDYVNIIKLDFKTLSDDDMRNIVFRISKKQNLILLAEKVETHEELESAKRIGFTLFQGYYFGKPIMHQTSSLQSINTVYFNLMNAVNRNEIDFNAVANMILQDMSLTYYLLRLVNAPAFGMVKRVTSVKHALVVLGEKEIKKWISLIVLSVAGKDKPDELIQMSLLRARLAEQLSKKTLLKANSEHFFLAGLFSMLDVILDRSFEQIVEEIFLPDSVKNYLLNNASYLVPVMKLVIAYEQGDWDQVFIMARILKIDQKDMIESYQNALKWQNDLKLA
jgi:c-di-GMP-related signal transduction protein